MDNKRLTKGIWIPIEIWKDKNLTWNEKILFLEIDSFTSADKDCYFSNEYISELLGVNETNANKILSSLIKKGYVLKTKFDGRHRYVKTAMSYTTTQTCNNDNAGLSYSTNQGCQYQQGCLVAEDNHNNTYNKQDNNKYNKEEKEDKSSSKKKFGDIDLSAIKEEHLPVITEWLEYKKEKKQQYKPKGFQMMYKKLMDMSNGDTTQMRLIVEQSMMNNYDGLFPLKNGGVTSAAQANSMQSEEPTEEQILEKFRNTHTPQFEAEIYMLDPYSFMMMSDRDRDVYRKNNIYKKMLLDWIKDHPNE